MHDSSVQELTFIRVHTLQAGLVAVATLRLHRSNESERAAAAVAHDSQTGCRGGVAVVPVRQGKRTGRDLGGADRPGVEVGGIGKTRRAERLGRR